MIRALAKHEPVRYSVSGAAAAIANNIVLIGGDRLGISYVVLVAASWFIGGTLAFALHSHVTFRKPTRWSSYGRFMAGAAFGVPLALALVAVMLSGLGWPMWIVAPASTLIMYLYNYASARLAIMRKLAGR